MLLFHLGLLAVLLPLCSFAPGFYFVRKLPWNPMEKLCGSVGLSLILIYLASWGIYCVGGRGNGLPVHAAPFWAVSLVCGALAAACGKDIVRLVRVRSVGRTLAGYGFLLLWTALLLSLIRNYSGGLWFGDWLEHFQRSLFFLRHFPAQVTIFPGYPLPARPPMMNVLAAFFLAQTSDRFELFQAIFAFLNLLLFLPCCLIMPALGKRAKRRTWLLLLLFVSSPLVMQNTTYTWTKAAAAFYVVLALWLYLAGWRKKDRARTTAAFVALAAGLLVHYSAGPYVVVLTLHYLLRVFPRRQGKWRELTGIAAACGLLLGTWLVWSLAVFGAKTTFESNSSVTASQDYKGSTAEKVADNLFDSIVPAVVREPALLNTFHRQRFAGEVRDWFFIFYQVNAIFGMGLVGGPLVVWLAFRELRRKRPVAPPVRPLARGKRPPRKIPEAVAKGPSERQFWAILIAGGLVLGIAVVGERDQLGVAHLTLLSLQTVGIAMLAAVIPWRRRSLAILLLAGCAVDVSMGVLLHARAESWDNSPQARVFPEMEFVSGAVQASLPGPDALSYAAWLNWINKGRLGHYRQWQRELQQRYGNDPDFQKVAPQLQQKIEQVRADDARAWQGWFGRHGHVEFLGDHWAGSSAAANGALAALCLVFLGLAATVFRRTA